MEIRAKKASAKLRQSNRTTKQIELTKQLLRSCWTAFSFEEQLKTANMNSLPFSFLVTTSAEAFLVTFGRKISYLLYDAIHEKSQVSQTRNLSKVTQKSNFIVILKCLDLECKLFFMNVRKRIVQRFCNYHVTDVEIFIKRNTHIWLMKQKRIAAQFYDKVEGVCCMIFTILLCLFNETILWTKKRKNF